MIPVVFIHFNSIPSYMLISLKQAMVHNQRVVLITDASFSMDGVEVHNSNTYLQGVDEFDKVYKHLSTNTFEFERICIVRWFILRNFMRQNSIDVAYYSDSDTMIYDKVSKVFEQYKDYDASYTVTEKQDTYRWTASACCSFWKMKTIDSFCSFVISLYANNLAKLEEKWSWHRQNKIAGGVCDMTLLYLFIPEVRFYALTKETQGISFDQNMLSPENYYEDEYDFGWNRWLGRSVKTIHFKNGKPYYFNKRLQKEVRIIAIAEYAKLLHNKRTLYTIARSAMARIVRRILPSRKPVAQYGWLGNYSSWEAARKECGGYDAKNILEKVKASVWKVKKGEAAFERDSVAFDTLQYSQPLLNALKIAAKDGVLHVTDFGGSLGSTFFQYRQLLGEVNDLRWTVVEQAHFVETGKQEIAEGPLYFAYTVEEAIQHQRPQVLLVSSVIQYFEKPYELIEKLQSYHFDHIIVDRTAFLESSQERITRQVVPPEIYEASYPAWFFNEKKFVAAFMDHYELLHAFNSDLDGEDWLEGKVRAYRKGFHFKQRKEP